MKVLNFLLRMVFGAIGIQLINALLLSQNISVFVGLNVLTLLTVGSLGISGRAGAALRNCGLRNFVNILQWTNPEKTAILYLRSFKKFLNLADAGIGAARICGLTQTIIPVWT